MIKKRLLGWSMALMILGLFAAYQFTMLSIKTEKAEAECVRFWLYGCDSNNHSGTLGCCPNGWNNRGDVWCGFSTYDRYATLCSQ